MKYWKIIQFTAAAVVLTAMTACSNNDDPIQENQTRHEIHFTSNLTGMDVDVTRAYGNFTNYSMNQVFWVWADMYDDMEQETTTYFNAWQLTVSSNTSKFSTNSAKMFPAYNTLSFYTLHGNFSEDLVEEAGENLGTTWPDMLTHTVKTTQMSDADYQVSDLVYAINRNTVPTADPVNLVFKHLMAQVEVALIPGNGLTADNLTSAQSAARATVEIMNVKTKVEFRPNKEAEMDTYAKRELMLSNASEVDTIVISTVPTDDKDKPLCGAAVVVPQQVNGKFIHISYLGYDTYVSVSNLRLKSGYRYRFNVTVDRIGGEYSITPVTVEEWTAEPSNRVAELE